MVDRGRLAELLQRERAEYAQRNPLSGKAFASAEHLFGRVPMTWMNKRAGALPALPRLAPAVPGCATSTGTTTSTSPSATPARWPGTPRSRRSRAVQRRFGELGGATAMLPTEDAEWVGAELTRRFGLPRWSFALTATDANRWAIRLVRAVTGRPQDPGQQLLLPRLGRRVADRGRARTARRVSREGNVGAPYDVTQTSRVAEFNDLEGLERAARPRRRGGGADGAGADQHRHRAARSRATCRACAS